MAETTDSSNNLDELLLTTQSHLIKTEAAKKDLIENTRKSMQLKFEKIQELREKFKIESEKQKLLLGVLGKMKESQDTDKWESNFEDSEHDYLKKQLEILNFR